MGPTCGRSQKASAGCNPGPSGAGGISGQDPGPGWIEAPASSESEKVSLFLSLRWCEEVGEHARGGEASL